MATKVNERSSQFRLLMRLVSESKKYTLSDSLVYSTARYFTTYAAFRQAIWVSQNTNEELQIIAIQ